MFYLDDVMLRELHSTKKLDELSFYLEISKLERILANQKENLIIVPGEEIHLNEEIRQTKEKLNLYKKELIRFGIDKDTFDDWKRACSKYLDDLDMNCYMFFSQMRKTCQDLSVFCPATLGESSFLPKSNKEEKTLRKEKAIKVS